MKLKEANELYRNGKFKEALFLYQEARDSYDFGELLEFQILKCKENISQKSIESKLPRFGISIFSDQLLDVFIFENIDDVLDSRTGLIKDSHNINYSKTAKESIFGGNISSEIMISISVDIYRKDTVRQILEILKLAYYSGANSFQISMEKIWNQEKYSGSIFYMVRNKDFAESRDFEKISLENVEFHKKIFSFKKIVVEKNISSRVIPSPLKIKKAFGSSDEFIKKCIADAHVINLSHRVDRKNATEYAFEKMGVQPRFVDAIYGKESKVVAESLKDTRKKEAALLEDGEFEYAWDSDFYRSYTSIREREKHYCSRQKKLFSAGSVAYMLSYRKALIQALCNSGKTDYISIFDDDVVLHKNWRQIIDSVVSDLPSDFMALSLGAIQYNWDGSVLNSVGDSIYQCYGISLASHAQVYRKDIAIKIVCDIEKMSLPYDVGTLHYLKKSYFDNCYVVNPNLFIQDSSESDIADTNGQLKNGVKLDNPYRWSIPDYFWFSDKGMKR